MAAPRRRPALAAALLALLAERAAVEATSGGYPLALIQAVPQALTSTTEQDEGNRTDTAGSGPDSDMANVSVNLGDVGESQDASVLMSCGAVMAAFTNCWGEDIGTGLPVATVEECCAHCAGDSNCTAWTVDSRSVVHEPGTQGRCWLKSSCSDRRDDNLAISGFMAVHGVNTSPSATSSLTSTTSGTSTTASDTSASDTGTTTELATSITSTETTTGDPFDCRVGVYSWKSGWSESKKDWCCATHPPLGCRFRSAENSLFHCMSGHSTWEAGWSAAKKDWCCQHYHPLGCRNSTTDPFDCKAGQAKWKVGWSEAKKSWCCRSNPPTGCPADQPERSAPFDCLDATSSWETEWSEVKKKWCCHEKTGYGCPVANGSLTTTTITPVRTSPATNTTTTSTTKRTATPIASSTASNSTASNYTGSNPNASNATPTASSTTRTTTPISATSPPTESSTSTTPTTSTTTTQQCFYADFAYEPLDMNRFTIEKNIEACQERCAKTDGCQHFSFYLAARNCHLEGQSSTRVAHRIGFVSGPRECCGGTGCGNQTLHGNSTYLPREFRCMRRAVQWIPELPGQSRVLGAGECPTQESAVLACQRACASSDRCAHFTIVFPHRLCSLSGEHARPIRPVFGALSGPPSCDEEDALSSVGLFATLASARDWLTSPGSHASTAAVGFFGLGLAFWVMRAAAQDPAGLGARSAVGRRYALLTVDSDDDEMPQGQSGRHSGSHRCRMP